VVAGLTFGLRAVRPLSVTWTAPLQLRYAVCGAIQVLYAFASLASEAQACPTRQNSSDLHKSQEQLLAKVGDMPTPFHPVATPQSSTEYTMAFPLPVCQGPIFLTMGQSPEPNLKYNHIQKWLAANRLAEITKE